MKTKNKRGFTLIELLAVIVILAIILIIAIPSVTGLIDDAKKDSFLSTARMMKSAARLYTANEANVVLPTTQGHAIVIMGDELNMDNMGKNPDGDTYDPANSYIVIAANASGSYDYYVTLLSAGANSRGLYVVPIDALTRADVFGDKAAENVVAPAAGTWTYDGTNELTIDKVYNGT